MTNIVYRYSKILIQNHIINFKSAEELMNQMAAKNFHISDFLKICIEVRDRKLNIEVKRSTPNKSEPKRLLQNFMLNFFF